MRTIVIALLPLLATGCAGATTTPRANATTTAACSAAPPGPLPLVGWSTDQLSRFQSAADRDVVFVRWEACTLTVIDTCRDESIAGRFGAYKPMRRLPLAEDHRTVQSADEARRLLPLAPPDVHVPFEIDVITRGTREATRDAWSHAELDTIPDCARATHAVRAFDVGAFTLQAGAISSRQGDLASCADDATDEGCRVPLRVSLAPLSSP